MVQGILKNEDALFLLLRVGLGIEEEPQSFPIFDWPAISEIARVQGGWAWVFAVLEKLPKERRPKTNLLLQWIAVAEQIKQRNRLVDKALSTVKTRLDEDGWAYNVFKGRPWRGSLSAA